MMKNSEIWRKIDHNQFNDPLVLVNRLHMNHRGFGVCVVCVGGLGGEKKKVVEKDT